MDMQERFQKNLVRWSQFCPEAAKLIPQQVKEPFFATATAEEWLKGLDFSTFKLLYVYGLGNTIINGALKEWYSDTKNQLVILEDDPQAFANFFYSKEAEELLLQENIWIYYLDPDDSSLEHLAKLFGPIEIAYEVTTIYPGELKKMFLQELKGKIAILHYLYAVQGAEFSQFGLRFLGNYFCNLFTWPSSSMGDHLFNKFKDVPAIICGAGPLLYKNIETLKKLKNRALIFAGGSAMNALNAEDLFPHLGLGIDPHEDLIMRTIMINAFETPYLYRNRINPNALRFIHSDKLHITGSSGYTISEYFEKACHIRREEVEEGCNVLNFSLALAEAMGCNPIILVGVDLAYSGGQSYSQGLTLHPIHGCQQFFRTKHIDEELIPARDIYGNPVMTLRKWLAESLWFSRFAQQHSSISILNATEGGMGIANIPNMPLSEVVSKFLTEEQDLECRLFGEIQCAKTPPEVTKEKLLELFEKLGEGLHEANEFIQSQQKELELLKQQNMETPPEVPRDIKTEFYRQRQQRLIDDPGYRYLLRSFDAAFDLFNRRKLVRLSIDNNLLPLQKWQEKLIDLEWQRTLFLSQTALILHQLISQIASNEKSHLHIKREEIPRSIPSWYHYKFENQQIELVDPDCNLNIKEPFAPDPNKDTFFLYYPNGRLKLISYKKEEKFHGPTHFYDQNGSLLAEHWYLEGLQEGKAFHYYPSKKLHSIQQYRRGLKYGFQEYYYEDGTLKSSLHYNSSGLLEGIVSLYSPLGKLVRQIEFKGGKRNGKERCWTDDGLLYIEAEFLDNIPTGTARTWHLNGQVSQETVYNPPGEVYTFTQWDEAGQVIQNHVPKDYYYHVAQKTKKLTESLKLLFEQLNTLAPTLVELSKDEKLKPEIQDSANNLQAMRMQLTHIEEEINHLETLSDQLFMESDIESQNKKEAVWKTASLQIEMQKKLNTAAKLMQNELEMLKGFLTKTIQSLQEPEEEKGARAEEEED